MKFVIDGLRFKTSGSIDGFGDNVATQVAYSIHESSSLHQVRRGFTMNLQAPVSSSFIGWDSLAEQTVIGWVTQSLGPDKLIQMQGWLDAGIQRKENSKSGFATGEELPF